MLKKLVGHKEFNALRSLPMPRPRLNVHQSFDDKVQRMIYCQRDGEHKPPHANARELTKVILKGHSELRIYDDNGTVVGKYDITPEGNCCYTLAPGTWHSNINRSPEVWFFEVMEGPYVPGADIKVMDGKV